MEIFRKYFNEKQLRDMEATGPNWGVNVHTVGHYVHPPDTSYPDPEHPSTHLLAWEKGRRLQEFQIVYIANGRGIYEGVDRMPVEVQTGTIMLHFPQVWHRYQPALETGWEEFWVGFDGHFAEYLMRQDCFDPQKPLIGIGFNVEFLNVFTRLIDTVRQEGVAFRQMASCFVIQMLGLVYASALLKSNVLSRHEQIVHAVRLELHDQWQQNPDMAQIAARYNVGYEWLRKAFKAHIGVPPGQYLLQLKIEKAAQMLRETNLTIREIANRAGFESEFYFSRIFKEKKGLAPILFKKG
jgi:AraC-like DNA-binding protein